MRGIEVCTLSDIIKERIDNFSLDVDVKKSGKILDSKYGLCRVYGLGDSQPGSIVKFEDIIEGVVIEKELDGTVIVALLGKEDSISEDVVCTLTDKEIINSNFTISCQDEIDFLKGPIGRLAESQLDLSEFKNIITSKKEKHWIKLNNRFNRRKR